MSNLSQNFDGNRQHPPQEDFLLFVDGELTPKETERWEAHLDACWSCRVRVAKIEETITEIIEFEDTVSQFQSVRSGAGWGNFDSLLHAATLEAENRSFIGRISDYFRSGQHTRLFSGSLQFAVPAVAAVLVVAIVWQFVLVQPVTAAVVLQRSIEAQAKRIDETEQPVVHQRIRVRQKEVGVTWEIWNDTANSRVKQSVLPEGVVRVKSDGKRTEAEKAVLLAESARLDNEFVSDLRDVLWANGMNEHRPLSAASYKAWSDSISAKTETVAEGKDTFTITTTTENPENTQIAEARLTINSSDYHPTSLYIRTTEQEFELAEQAYEVVSLKDVDPAVFADPTKVEVASTVGTNTAASVPPAATNANTNTEIAANTNTALPPNMPNATSAEEVEVLELLHKVGADISEQLSVTRTADGRLLVEGLVDGDKRKAEILNALAPVRNNPAIRIKIQTIEEATKALQKQKAQSTPGRVERVDLEKGAIPTDADLRQHFAARGGDTDLLIRQYASRVISRSQTALFQASALNRMAARFNAAQLAEMTPEARAKFLGILKGYAAVVRRETAALRNELNPVFGGFEAGGGESVTSDADLIASARRLYELAGSNDRVVSSAFTLSRSGGSASGVKTAGFRRSIAQAEALATAIEQAR